MLAMVNVCFVSYPDICLYKSKTLILFLGTHVAGTIGGNSYGVAKNTILHGVKILDRNGDGTTAALIQGKKKSTNNLSLLAFLKCVFL